MNKEFLIQQIKKKAKQDKKNRQDRRFLETMSFLISKGFLITNLDLPLLPNKRLQIDDAIWAGQNVEPRILEVLPAAVLRLEKHFDLDPIAHPELKCVVDQLRRREINGNDFFGISYDKIKIWTEFPLLDKRVKTIGTKKIVKTFRLNPRAVDHLHQKAQENGCTETEVLEKLLEVL